MAKGRKKAFLAIEECPYDFAPVQHSASMFAFVLCISDLSHHCHEQLLPCTVSFVTSLYFSLSQHGWLQRLVLHCPPSRMIPNVEHHRLPARSLLPTRLACLLPRPLLLCLFASSAWKRRHQPKPSQRQLQLRFPLRLRLSKNSLSTILHQLEACFPSNRTTSSASGLLTGPHRSSALDSLRFSEQPPVHTRRSRTKPGQGRKRGDFDISSNRG